jgi:hypothetical protein
MVIRSVEPTSTGGATSGIVADAARIARLRGAQRWVDGQETQRPDPEEVPGGTVRDRQVRQLRIPPTRLGLDRGAPRAVRPLRRHVRVNRLAARAAGHTPRMPPLPNGLRILFLVAAVVCFVIALLLATHTFTGGNDLAWAFGGALAFVLAHFP